jgi:hypothetical protein
VAWCLGWGRDSRRMAGAGCPRWPSSAGEERRWWSEGVAECAGKEVGGAPGVGAELRAVTESSEGDRGGSMTTARWHSGGNGQRRKRVAHGEERSF